LQNPIPLWQDISTGDFALKSIEMHFGSVGIRAAQNLKDRTGKPRLSR
jgi:hypothetical protein